METAVKGMCGKNLKCVARTNSDQQKLDLNTDEMANLVYSGEYVCVASDNAATEVDIGVTATVTISDCQNSSRDKRGFSKASCNLYDLN